MMPQTTAWAGEGSLSVVVLAAGKGTRMRSSLPKVLHPLWGEPLLAHVLRLARRLSSRPVVVVPKEHGALLPVIGPEVEVAVQEQALGTGHALKSAIPHLAAGRDVLVLYGDCPLVTEEAVAPLIRGLDGAAGRLLSLHLEEPKGYGRILRDGANRLQGIREERDASEEEKAIREVNSGFYRFAWEPLLWALDRLRADNAQKEYYLTDVVGLWIREGYRVTAEPGPDPPALLGINTPEERHAAERLLLERQRQRLLASGVLLESAESVLVGPEVEAEPGSRLIGPCRIRGRTRIGTGATVGPGTSLADCQVGEGSVLQDVHFVGVTTGQNCRIADSGMGMGGGRHGF